MSEGHKLTKKGTGLKLRGNQFGSLYINHIALQAGRLQARNEGNLGLDISADHLLYDLLTKRFVRTKQYTPQAIETVHGRKSKKHQLIRGGTIQYYNNPDALVDRLQLLVASKQAGNTGLDNEISAILDELLQTGLIHKESALQLNRSLFTT